MSYENAPATKMLATCCVACGRPLVDSVSVEVGMGPDCRARHGLEDDGTGDRDEANRIVHQLALWRGSHELAPTAEDVVRHLKRLEELGFKRLADVLTQRLVTLKILGPSSPLTFVVRTPAKSTFIVAVKRLGGRWEPHDKGWRVSSARKNELWAVLKEEFPGEVGTSPRGLFATPEVKRAVQTSLGLELTH